MVEENRESTPRKTDSGALPPTFMEPERGVLEDHLFSFLRDPLSGSMLSKCWEGR